MGRMKELAMDLENNLDTDYPHTLLEEEIEKEKKRNQPRRSTRIAEKQSKVKMESDVNAAYETYEKSIEWQINQCLKK